MDFDAVVLAVTDYNGIPWMVRAEGYIGFCFEGIWDEMIIERAEISEHHPVIQKYSESIARRLGPAWVDSRNATRNTRRWQALVVHFINGARLEIVAAAFTVE